MLYDSALVRDSYPSRNTSRELRVLRINLKITSRLLQHHMALLYFCLLQNNENLLRLIVCLNFLME